jgi:methylthioribulose-1-phosphate dehydratase
MEKLIGDVSEEDLTESLEAAMEKYPDTYAVLVRRHGV